jgi:hypothetical protein
MTVAPTNDPLTGGPMKRCFGKEHSSDCDAKRAEIERKIRERAAAGEPYDAERAKICPVMLAGIVRKGEAPGPAAVTVTVTVHNAHIDGSLNLRLAECCPLVLMHCRIDGDLILEQASVAAITLAEGTTVNGNILAREVLSKMGVSIVGTTVHGFVDLTNALVDGDLNCAGTTIHGCHAGRIGAGLVADGLECKGSALLRGLTAQRGGVRLVGARIGGTTDLRDAVLGCALQPRGPDDGRAELERSSGLMLTVEARNAAEAALCADLLRCEGSVLLDGLECTGDIRLLQARVSGQILANNVTIPHGSIRCNALECSDSVLLNGIGVREIPKKGSSTQGSAGGEENSQVVRKGVAKMVENSLLEFSGASIRNRLQITQTQMFELRLGAARVGRYNDDLQSMPAQGRLGIDDFAYGRIGFQEKQSEQEEFDARMAWIELATEHEASGDKWTWKRFKRSVKEWWRGSDVAFQPGPYAMFADLLDRRGRPHLATRVRIKRESRMARQKKFGKLRTAWALLLGGTVSYGYRPHKALLWLMLIPVCYGGLRYWQGARAPELASCEAMGAWLVTSYGRAALRVLPLPTSLTGLPAHEWPLFAVRAAALVLSSVGIAGLLKLLGKK